MATQFTEQIPVPLVDPVVSAINQLFDRLIFSLQTEKDSSLNRIEGQTRRNEGQSSGRSTDGGRIGCITEIIGGTNETQSAPFCAGENTWRVGK